MRPPPDEIAATTATTMTTSPVTATSLRRRICSLRARSA
jgi:hypothetical protein